MITPEIVLLLSHLEVWEWNLMKSKDSSQPLGKIGDLFISLWELDPKKELLDLVNQN